MPRLRLELRKLVYWYRWELMGMVGPWRKGDTSRLKTVALANERVLANSPLGD